MSIKIETQRTLQASNVDDHLLTWLEAFLIDCKAAGVEAGTLRFYCQKNKAVPGLLRCRGGQADRPGHPIFSSAISTLSGRIRS